MTVDAVWDRSEILTALRPEDLEFLRSVSSPLAVAEDEILFEEGGPADTFYIVSRGRIGLEVLGPGKPPMVIQTLGPGEMVGVSWMFAPHRWNWRARAWEDTALVAFDAGAVRGRASVDTEFGRRILEVVSKEAVERLQRTRLQLLDLYRKDPR